MFGQAVTFHSEEFKRGKLLVKGLALVEGEEPPVMETVYRLFTIDYLDKQLEAAIDAGKNSIPENTNTPPFCLDNLAQHIIDNEYEASDTEHALSRWGTITDGAWWENVDDSTLVTLATKAYDDVGVIFHYRKVNSSTLGTVFFLEYEEQP